MGQISTITVSSLWHGMYPAYYLTFGHWALVLQISQEIYRIRLKSPRFQKAYEFMMIGPILELIYSNYYMGYFGLVFLMMASKRFLVPIYATYFIPGIILYVSWLLIVQMGIFSTRKSNPQPISNGDGNKRSDEKEV